MTTDGRTTGRWFYAVAGLVVLLVAGVISRFASSDPDGLERVAADQGIDAQAQIKIDRTANRVEVETGASREAVAAAIAEEGYKVA